LYIGNRCIGIIWADRTSGDVTDEMWQPFQLFFAQANLARLRMSPAGRR